MEEIDILKRAQYYVEQMANGYNPLTGEEIDENDFINNVRISRCLFYVNGKLKELIQNGGEVNRTKRQPKEKFVYDQEKIDKVVIEDRDISLSEIIRNIQAAYDNQCRLSYSIVATLLQEKGILIANNQPGAKLIASPQAAKYGIHAELAHGRNGDYMKTLYNADGQKLVLTLIKDLNVN